jgi:hypothetical protein
MKKRAEALMIIGESEKGRALHSGKDWNMQSNLSYYDYLREGIDMMRAARIQYNIVWGDHHPKSHKVVSQLGRFEIAGGHSSANPEFSIILFEDALSTFTELISIYEYQYRHMNANYETKILGDPKLVLHKDIYTACKYKLIAAIHA